MKTLILIVACTIGVAQSRGAETKITPETLLDNVATALGGKAFKEMQTLWSEGTMTIEGANLKGTCAIYAKAPGMSRMTVRVTDMMDSTEATDGTVAWDYNPFFAVFRNKDGREADYMLLHSKTDLLTHYKKHFKSWKIVGKSTVNGHACHMLKLTPNNKVKPFIYHIDTTTFLVRREESTFDGPQGKFSIVSDIDAYKKVKGVNVPKELTIGMSQMKIKVVFDSIKVNAPLPDALFKNPDEMTIAIKQKNRLEYEVGEKNPVVMGRRELLEALKTINSVKKDFKISKIVLSGAKDVDSRALTASSYWLRNLAMTVDVQGASVEEPPPATETTPEPETKTTKGGDKE